MDEANGTYRDRTEHVWQIKHPSRTEYEDNVTSTLLDGGLGDLKAYVDGQSTENLDHRIIKRTVKEDVVYGPHHAQQ